MLALLLQLSAVNLSAKVFEDPGVSRSVFSAVPSDQGASSKGGVGVWNESGEVRSGGDEGVPPPPSLLARNWEVAVLPASGLRDQLVHTYFTFGGPCHYGTAGLKQG